MGGLPSWGSGEIPRARKGKELPTGLFCAQGGGLHSPIVQEERTGSAHAGSTKNDSKNSSRQRAILPARSTTTHDTRWKASRTAVAMQRYQSQWNSCECSGRPRSGNHAAAQPGASNRQNLSRNRPSGLAPDNAAAGAARHSHGERRRRNFWHRLRRHFHRRVAANCTLTRCARTRAPARTTYWTPSSPANSCLNRAIHARYA